MAEVLIRKPSSKAIPRYWLFIDWNLRTFVCRYCEYAGHSMHTINQSSGVNSQFFLYLNSLRNKKNVAIWSTGWQIYEFLCSAGLYEAVTSGSIQITDGKVHSGKPLSVATVKKMIGGLVCENPPTIIDCLTAEGQKIKFLDVGNWGISRNDIDFEGCKPDCDIPQDAIEQYISMVETLDMGTLKCTAASQGYYAFRYNSMHHPIYADNDEHARPIERSSYFAGRAEAFRLGKLPGTVWHLDVKSMYTSIGSLFNFPTRLIDVRFNQHPRIIQKLACQYGLIAHVNITTDYPCYPLRDNNRVIWPIGNFDTFLAGPELIHAYSKDRIVHVHSLCRYEMEPIFQRWAQWYFNALSSLDGLGLSAMKGALKLTVNSMYGKIGQRSKMWKDVVQHPPRFRFEQYWGRHPVSKTMTPFRVIDGCIQYLDSSQESATSCPAISSYMSSYGRMRLWDIIETAGLSNCYYCDTDGVMVNREGFDILRESGYVKEGVYGSLSIREVSNDVEIFGIKHYRFGDRWCCSGVPANIAYRIDGTITYSQHSPFADGLWHRKPFEHEYKMIERRYKKEYKHGIRESDGRVSTFIVEMGTETTGDENGGSAEQRKPRVVGAKSIFHEQ